MNQLFVKICGGMLLALFITPSLTSAQSALPMPRNIRKAYDQQTRSLSGAPGPRYWQNHASYNIRVNFDPATRKLNGSETIVYYNNSPDTLRMLNFKLYPNLYKKGAIRQMPLSDHDVTDGVNISELKINGAGKTAHVNPSSEMPMMIAPLAPRDSLRIDLQFAYILNKDSHIRTGQVDSTAFFIAYWFPRVAVYDDVFDWDLVPYSGMTEFYNDFSDFRVAVTVPGPYMVWATGDLQNCSEVYTDKICERIAAAEKNDAISDIIDTTDLQKQQVTRPGATHTWVYKAAHVTDFAFALSDHYIWKSGSVEVDPATKRRTRVDAVFNPAHADFYEVADIARTTVEKMSDHFPRWPFPYSHETIFDGLDQMEYPMMVNDNPLPSRTETIELTDHEIFHTMFPFYMGTNEARYAWMDEGWATIGEWIISPLIDSTIVDSYGVDSYNMIGGTEMDQPIMIPSYMLSRSPYTANAYSKPALGYLYLKDMLGDSLFLKGLHHYIRLWNGKHPLPWDFFYSMNAGTGRNLNWFWKNWFFDGDIHPDLGISNVKQTGTQATATIVNKGGKAVPVHLVITFTDGTQTTVHKSIAVWEKGNKTVQVPFTARKKIKKVELGYAYSTDVDLKDNVYTMPL